jgi:hypothetical protein
MDYDNVIAELQAYLKGTLEVQKQSGPVQAMGSGATAALLQIAIQLAQFNKNFEAYAASIVTPAPPPAPGPTSGPPKPAPAPAPAK